jgi:hypothetical protein
MDASKIAEILAFFFHDWEFKGDTAALWESVIDLIQQIFSKLFG